MMEERRAETECFVCQTVERSPAGEICFGRIYSGHLLCNVAPKTFHFLINNILLFCANHLI